MILVGTMLGERHSKQAGLVGVLMCGKKRMEDGIWPLHFSVRWQDDPCSKLHRPLARDRLAGEVLGSTGQLEWLQAEEAHRSGEFGGRTGEHVRRSDVEYSSSSEERARAEKPNSTSFAPSVRAPESRPLLERRATCWPLDSLARGGGLSPLRRGEAATL